MKKWILLTALIFCSLLTVQAVELEKWTYDGLINPFTSLGNVPSLTGTDSAFGTTTSGFLGALEASGYAFIANNANPPPSYSQSIFAPSYAGNTSGAYKISFDIPEASFAGTGTGKGQFGWGLRSNANGQDDCNVLFRYDNGEFQLVATDASGTKTPVTIATGSTLANLSVSMIFNLGSKGSLGSFAAFYQLEGGLPILIFPQQLALHDDFQIDEFVLQFDMTSPGFAWAANDVVFFDNLIFETVSSSITLTNIGQQISFIEDKGVFPGADTYEPGDILQVITENVNDSVIAATDVTTILTANSTAFSITSISSNAYPSINPNESFTGVFQVKVLAGAQDGSNTFSVINTIGAGN